MTTPYLEDQHGDLALHVVVLQLLLRRDIEGVVDVVHAQARPAIHYFAGVSDQLPPGEVLGLVEKHIHALVQQIPLVGFDGLLQRHDVPLAEGTDDGAVDGGKLGELVQQLGLGQLARPKHHRQQVREDFPAGQLGPCALTFAGRGSGWGTS